MPAVDRRVITGLISVVFAIRLLSSFYLRWPISPDSMSRAATASMPCLSMVFMPFGVSVRVTVRPSDGT